MAKDKRIQYGTECWSDNYQKSRDDHNFLSDRPGAQWDEGDYVRRKNDKRPALEMDQLEQYVNRVVNDMRASTPSITVTPKDEQATEGTAQVFQGMIRAIEKDSRADDAYDTAGDQAVTGAIGYIKVDTAYESERTFNQVLRIRKVVNPHSIFLDPDSVMVDGSDAKWAFEVECVSEEKFKATYPGKEVKSYSQDDWSVPEAKEGYINIVTMYEIEETEATLAMLRDGTIQEVDEIPAGMDVVTSRKIRKRRVKWTTRGAEDTVLDDGYFPGVYVPLVPVYGKETWIDGKRQLRSLVRKAKDAQRMYNYWRSTEMELLQKQPKAQVIAARGTIEKYTELWRNPDGTSILPYEAYDDEGNQLPPPTIGNPVSIPEGIINAANESRQEIKDALGLHDAYTGQKSNEVSGRALTKRSQESDNAIYHFTDNLTKSIRFVGEIIVRAIPEVYDAPRLVGIVGKDGKVTMVGINGAQVPGQTQSVMLSKGQYAVDVTTGGSFASQREAAAQFFESLIMTNPEMFNILGDIYCENLDFPGAQAAAARLRAILPPQVKMAESGQDPALVQAQQTIQQLTQALQQAQGKIEQMKMQLQSRLQEAQIRATTEVRKDQTERMKQSVEMSHMALEKEKLTLSTQIALAEIELEKLKLLQQREMLAEAGEGADTGPERESDGKEDDND